MTAVLSPRSSMQWGFSYLVPLNCKVSLKSKIGKKRSVKTAVLIFGDRSSANINCHTWVETSP